MKRLLLIAIIFLLGTNSFAQKHSSKKIGIADRFDTYVKQAMPLWKTPGLSIVVVKDNQVVFKKGYGLQDLGKPDSVNPATIAICASTTKAMTAVCMGMLVDEGKVKWTDKVSDLYPELKLYDDYVNSHLMVQDLFTHNAGLGNADYLWLFDLPSDSIVQKLRYLKPAYTYHSSFIYQNVMYMMAGQLIQKLTGKSWEQFIAERLFTPLGMTNSYASFNLSKAVSNRMTPHYMFEDSLVKAIPNTPYQAVGSAGGVWSCANDMEKWMQFLLDSASVNGKKLLQPQTFARLFKPTSFVTESQFYPTAKLTKPHWTTYGLGWFQQDYLGKMLQFHTGSLAGAVAILGLVPDEHFGIYIFGNLDHTEIRHALMLKAIDLWVLNKDTNDWSKDLYALYSSLGAEAKKRDKETEDKRVLNTKPSLALADYCGTYHHEVYGDMTVMMQGDSLAAQFPANIRLALSHWHYDSFMGQHEQKWRGKEMLQFQLGTNGKVKALDFDGLIYTKKE